MFERFCPAGAHQLRPGEKIRVRRRSPWEKFDDDKSVLRKKLIADGIQDKKRNGFVASFLSRHEKL